MTLEPNNNIQPQSQQQQPQQSAAATIDWNQSEFKEDIAYFLELAKSTVRSHEIMRSQLLKLGPKIAEKFFSYDHPEMINTIPSIFTSLLHKEDIYEFDQMIDITFRSTAWLDSLKEIEKSYSQLAIDYNNVLGMSYKKGKRMVEDYKQASNNVVDMAHTLAPEQLRSVIDEEEKRLQHLKEIATDRKVAYVSSDEQGQTADQSLQRKAEQLKTPKYKITDDNIRRQEIVIEGIQACIDQFQEMIKVVGEIPIESDEQAYRWRQGFVHLANNFTALGDDKHRMDFAGWAKTLKNINLYGAEKGLKMSGCEITDHDISLIDESTLPLHFYDKYQKIGLSYISKEHLDSKGVLIANVFIDMVNMFAWLESAAEMFAYQSKIRGIRAIAVSNKLSESK